MMYGGGMHPSPGYMYPEMYGGYVYPPYCYDPTQETPTRPISRGRSEERAEDMREATDVQKNTIEDEKKESNDAE